MKSTFKQIADKDFDSLESAERFYTLSMVKHAPELFYYSVVETPDTPLWVHWMDHIEQNRAQHFPEFNEDRERLLVDYAWEFARSLTLSEKDSVPYLCIMCDYALSQNIHTWAEVDGILNKEDEKLASVVRSVYQGLIAPTSEQSILLRYNKK